MAREYETVIGLEVHVELATKTKIFCGCSTEFGGAPNTHTCPVCTGMPGSLPVLNKQVVEYAMAVGLATDCQIHQKCKFDRKNYFYFPVVSSDLSRRLGGDRDGRGQEKNRHP